MRKRSSLSFVKAIKVRETLRSISMPDVLGGVQAKRKKSPTLALNGQHLDENEAGRHLGPSPKKQGSMKKKRSQKRNSPEVKSKYSDI